MQSHAIWQYDRVSRSLSLWVARVSWVLFNIPRNVWDQYCNDTQTQTQHYQLIEGRLYLCSELVIVIFWHYSVKLHFRCCRLLSSHVLLREGWTIDFHFSNWIWLTIKLFCGSARSMWREGAEKNTQKKLAFCKTSLDHKQTSIKHVLDVPECQRSYKFGKRQNFSVHFLTPSLTTSPVWYFIATDGQFCADLKS